MVLTGRLARLMRFLVAVVVLVLLCGPASAQAADIQTVDPAPGRCVVKTPMPDVNTAPRWTSWGVDWSNSRFQSRAQAGLSAVDLPKLKLKWAFGLPDSSHAWSQPTVAGGRVFIGSQGGHVYSLDARTGCIHWSFLATGATRTAVVIGPRPGRPGSRGIA